MKPLSLIGAGFFFVAGNMTAEVVSDNCENGHEQAAGLWVYDLCTPKFEK